MVLWLLVALPLVVGGALLVAGHPADRLASALGVGSAGLTAVLAVVAAITRPDVSTPLLAGLRVGLAVDGLSAIMVITVAVILVAVLVFASAEFGADESRARFHGLMLVFAGAMLVTVCARDLVVLLMAWEVMGACSYALIGFWWRETRRVDSGNIALLTTRSADLGLYLAAGAALAGGVGGLTLAGLPESAAGWRDVVAAGIVLAAIGKSAQLPFSFWLSRAMDGPSPVSALLHSATMVAAGAYLLVRVEPLLAATGWAADIVAWIGVITAIVLGAVALVQRDLKQVLAASTCSQIGFMVLAAGAGGPAAGTGQLVAHAATKCLLFLGAGAWLVALDTKDLEQLRGAARRFPFLGAVFTIGALSLAGVPPLSIWVTKDAVLASALADSPVLYVAGLAAALLSGAYVGRVLALLWLPTEAAPTTRLRPLLLAPLPVLAAAAALLGIAGLPGPAAWFADFVGGPPMAAPNVVELLVSGAVAVAGVVTAGIWARSRPTLSGSRNGVLTNWLHLERVTELVVTRPTMRLASGLARFDDHVVDGGVRLAAATGTALGRLADIRVEWSIEGAVRGIARTARALGRLVPKAQTGRLHQYYAQAAVALGVLAVLLMIL
ncbi:NADH-quinone oxidoreductase subunit L [Amycolatopsis roodepoortensis]|uniref:NADH:ubiquinone oxidoreductase subunit 5 (Subunit L)/multisubunit Na+/H+ antiporter MnhA subunit n=1 Tax=Amycolatopsis roodepoortensis TaxID=700274 RepID=A0ABR9L3P6_9PSEU|nr:proton-conducting transporter membrane subunit [Amycolatopsis roodepoortensis]MBE1575364.1 NADH:ubiquinone oxidoreductase subunit 5 (subunit L)/multisubunit Na+/H+ antiporter MnhA subunit [Amycolatopsis roodepoortensis]